MPNLVKIYTVESTVYILKNGIYFQNPLKVSILKGLVVGLGGHEPPTSPLSVIVSERV